AQLDRRRWRPGRGVFALLASDTTFSADPILGGARSAMAEGPILAGPRADGGFVPDLWLSAARRDLCHCPESTLCGCEHQDSAAYLGPSPPPLANCYPGAGRSPGTF